MTFPISHNQEEYSVSELSQMVKATVEDRFGYVRVRGEISGLKAHSSGHLYLSLKDDKAVINAVSWRGVWQKFAIRPEDGMEVIATGRITTFPGKSQYQLVVERMEVAGVGALMALLEERKKKLAAEGLFDLGRKRALPFLPGCIGVVTSPTGAVIRDILHRLADRCPVQVLVWPVMVQGEGAAEKIAAAIEGFHHLPDSITKPDVLIVARGGGSIEDLWAFNEEIVARAVANATIPIISAVGHETDTTLIDYVSDRRAPTPTAAAEMAVPVRHELLAWLESSGVRASQAMVQMLDNKTQFIAALSRGLPHPSRLLEQRTQHLDMVTERLTLSLPRLLEQKQHQLQRAIIKLSPQLLARELVHMGTGLEDLHRRLGQAITQYLLRRGERLEHLAALLKSYHYGEILSRGFAMVRNASGALISTAKQAASAQNVQIEFQDGSVGATIGDAKPITKAVSKAPVKKPAKPKVDQGSLF